MSLSAFTDELAQVRTKKKEFLEQINRIIPWGEWITLIQPSYYKGERGNKPYDLELMLRIYMLENLYDLSDEGTVTAATLAPKNEKMRLSETTRERRFVTRLTVVRVRSRS